MGRLLELKPVAAYGERAPFHPNLFWVLGKSWSMWFFSLWVSQRWVGECPFPATPMPSSQLLGLFDWLRDTAVSPSKPHSLHAASAATEGASACQVFWGKEPKAVSWYHASLIGLLLILLCPSRLCPLYPVHFSTQPQAGGLSRRCPGASHSAPKCPASVWP